MKYQKRIVDDILTLKLESFGAALIVGPKGCGKTTTAKQKAQSIIEFQDEDRRDEYLAVAATQPSRLLIGDKPRLFDEWQDAPKIWGAIRKSVDYEQENGLYILTGSTSQIIDTPHTGTQRISALKMYPMSLFESEESNGEVSLQDLFDSPEQYSGCHSKLTLDDLIFAICRGGWPRAVNNKTTRSQLEVAKDLFVQTHRVDISNVDKVKRNSSWAEMILRSYSRNICTIAKMGTIYEDVKANIGISEPTFYDYIEGFERLFMIEDVEAWNPAIRSKTTIRAARKKNIIDPSIAVAAMGLNPDYFNEDFKTLGFLFESLCIRDLRIYSSAHNGRVSYYRDRYGLEADAVLHFDDGRYALIEIKLGSHEIENGAKHILEIERLIHEHNNTEKQVPLRMPDLKIVLTGSEYGYRRDDGVFVIPIGCLKD
jgi:hypothetical protein